MQITQRIKIILCPNTIKHRAEAPGAQEVVVEVTGAEAGGALGHVDQVNRTSLWETGFLF